MRLFIRCVTGVVLSGACMLHASAPCRIAASGPFFLRPIPSSAVHHRQAPHIRLREGTSLNWSGYAVETNLANPAAGVVTDVTGSWIVPSVTGSGSTDTYSSAWVGIDGYSDDTVEQIGTEQDWTPWRKVYYAWFEMYPNYAYEIVGFPVVPGDEITAQVAYIGSQTVRVRVGWRYTTEVVETFQLTITNLTHRATYTTNQQIQSAERSSAEWVMEAPSGYSVLPLADFGVVNFFGCEATIGGHTGTISAWQHDPLTMETSNGATKAQPLALTAGGSAFEVTWHHQ